MLGLNTQRGEVAAGENGIAALVSREADARRFIDEAIDYAVVIDCPNIHVMAGFTDKKEPSQNMFAQNILYACQKAAACGKTILIEPLNKYDAPGYHISTLDEAQSVLRRVGAPNLKIMFDCYHMQIMGGNLLRRIADAAADIGHVQFASVPDRREPHLGEVNYGWLLPEIAKIGFDGPFGAEYKPLTTTDEGISWIKPFLD